MAENIQEVQTAKKGLNPMVLGVILSILFLIVGFGAGYFISQSSQKQTQVEKMLSLNTVNNLKLITSGQINDIQNDTITVEREEQQVSIAISANTEIRRLVYPTPEEAASGNSEITSESIDLSDLKTGDPIVITSTISKEGRVSTVDIVVLGSKEALPPISN